jgi:uncharacterized coiled-coil protein SlyX
MDNPLYAFLTAVCSVLLSLGVIIEYNHLKIKEAEDKGRLLQRIDELEKQMKEQKQNIGEADANHSKNEMVVLQHTKDIERINEKLDDLKASFENSLEKLSQAINDLAKEVRNKDR